MLASLHTQLICILPRVTNDMRWLLRSIKKYGIVVVAFELGCERGLGKVGAHVWVIRKIAFVLITRATLWNLMVVALHLWPRNWLMVITPHRNKLSHDLTSVYWAKLWFDLDVTIQWLITVWWCNQLFCFCVIERSWDRHYYIEVNE